MRSRVSGQTVAPPGERAAGFAIRTGIDIGLVLDLTVCNYLKCLKSLALPRGLEPLFSP
jgi:hypothetical protein